MHAWHNTVHDRSCFRNYVRYFSKICGDAFFGNYAKPLSRFASWIWVSWRILRVHGSIYFRSNWVRLYVVGSTFFRAFAFLFLLLTYLLSKQMRNLFWNALLRLLLIIFVLLIILTAISPQVLWPSYNVAQVYVRVFILFCLFYISIHTLKSHLEKPDPTTVMIPLGLWRTVMKLNYLLNKWIDSF